MKKLYIAFAILCLSLASAQQQNTSFSLGQAIDFAMKNSPNYLNADLDQKNAVYKKNQIAGAGLPQISGSIDIKDYTSLPTSLLPGIFFGAPGTYIPVKFGTKYNATAGFTASQLIFSSDYIFGLQASKEFIHLSMINVTRTKADLVSQVSKAYYGVIINKDRIKLLESNIARLKKTYDDTKAFNKEGFAELIDVQRLEVQYNNLLTEKEKTTKLIGLSETFLKFQMGYNLTDPIVLSDSLNVDIKQFEELNANKIDISKRPEYIALLSQQKLFDIDVKRLRYGYLPTIAAYGSYQYNAQRQKFDLTDKNQSWFKIALVGITLNLNIFDGFQRYNQIQQSSISSFKNKNNIRNIELGAELEATSASVSYSNAYATLKAQVKNMELAQSVYEASQKKYLGGIGSNLEVVTAETSLTEAQTNYYNAVYDMLVAKIDYQKAIGTLVK